MKKPIRKLQIHRETLHQLDSRTLEQIHGGLAVGTPTIRDTAVRPSDACPIPTSG